MVCSGVTCESRPYSGLLISSDSWRSLMVSMVSRSCWAIWSCGLEYRSDTRVCTSSSVEIERSVYSRGLVS